jgi:hypothetical protein
VVAPQQVDVLGIIYLQHQDQRHYLDAEFATVHVVPQEKILSAWNRPKFLEDAEEIIKLTMDIPDDYEGRV